jgi:hypothetical protein
MTRHVVMQRVQRKELPKTLGRINEKLQHLTANAHAKVEHPFHAIQDSVPSTKDPLSWLGEEHRPKYCPQRRRA